MYILLQLGQVFQVWIIELFLCFYMYILRKENEMSIFLFRSYKFSKHACVIIIYMRQAAGGLEISVPGLCC